MMTKVTPKERNERLRQAVRVLVELPPERKVDMLAWKRCEMVACAGGWIAQDEWFDERGLYIRNGEPCLQGHFGYCALVRFFGLSYGSIHHLFSPTHYTKYQQHRRSSVIARFKEFIQRMEMERLK